MPHHRIAIALSNVFGHQTEHIAHAVAHQDYAAAASVILTALFALKSH